jgi:hypothetical protein
MNSLIYLKIGLFMHMFMAYALLSDDGLLPGNDTILIYEKHQIKRFTNFLIKF